MKNIIVIIALILLCSCGVKNSYEDNPTTSNEVSKLVELKAFDTLVTLTAHDSLFIVKDNKVIKSVPLEKYKLPPLDAVAFTILSMLLIYCVIKLFFYYSE